MLDNSIGFVMNNNVRIAIPTTMTRENIWIRIYRSSMNGIAVIVSHVAGIDAKITSYIIISNLFDSTYIRRILTKDIAKLIGCLVVAFSIISTIKGTFKANDECLNQSSSPKKSDL
jgi:hypothetical protein